jgi:SAM-dependent methyltransferase
VLDIGCGTGYGSAELARTARSVTGIDVASNAVEYASGHYLHGDQGRALRWAQASCLALPFPDASFDLVVAFEVIEHLADWQGMLAETRRVLAPGGQFVVSTPNRTYYAESRRDSGPNPFHEHEFEFEEFREALAGYFPNVDLFLEDHTEGILFRAVQEHVGAEVRIEASGDSAENSNFFVAVCGAETHPSLPGFVYLPSAANLLRERGIHIRRLEEELSTKDGWLSEARKEHSELVDLHRAQTKELEERNAWAQKLNDQLEELRANYVREQQAAAQVATAYAAKVAELEEENLRKTEWATETERRLTAESEEAREQLVRCLELLHEAEATVEERTKWAQGLDREREHLAAKLGMVEASRWVRLGRVVGVGPQLRE